MYQKEITEFKATLYCKDEPLVDINYDGTEVTDVKLYKSNYLMPLELDRVISSETLHMFFELRTLPRSRQNLNYCLKQLGLKSYDAMEIIKRTYSLCTDDCYWLKFAGVDITYNDIKIRD